MQRKSLPLRALHAACVTAVAAVALPAAAQDFWSQNFIKPYDETFSLGLGGILNQFDTSVRLDGTSRQGTDISLEDNGLDKNLSSFELTGTWRFARRHRIDAQYFTTKRSGSHEYTREIDIGDTTFPLGARVDASSKNDMFNLDYRYSFIQNPEFELAGLFGFWGGKFTFDINAVGTGSAGSSTTYNKSSSTTLPLPLLGLTADWYPDKQWKFTALASGMKAKVGDVDGHAYVFGASGDYMFTRNLGAGLRYMYVDVQADVTKSSFEGNFSWRMNSVSLYAKLLF